MDHPGVVPSLAELAAAVSQALRAELHGAVGRDLDIVVMHGPVAQALIEVSAVAQAIVKGADRRSPLTRVLVSSVAPRPLEGAPCPVAVVLVETAGLDAR